MFEIYFETYGCTANQNNSEIMKALVRRAGLNITNNPNIADIIIINSCIVKGPTEEKIRRRISDLLKEGKKVIVAGCMPRVFKDKLRKENLYLLDVSQTTNIVKLIKDIFDKRNSFEKYLEIRKEKKVGFSKEAFERVIGITQISEGCFGKCTYCIVRIAKGKLFSYPLEEIVNSVEKDVKSGKKEIWITSQDNASYGNDYGKYELPKLLKKILEIKGNFLVRVGMMNPNNVIKILDELIEVYKNEKMFKFLHIPIQSGSDKVLKDMKRGYNTQEVLKIVSKFREEIPDILIATDIIVGYPTETNDDWEKTVSLLKKIKPEIVNRSNFSARPHTEASKLKPLDFRIIKKRSKELMDLHLKICKDIQKDFIGKRVVALIDKKGFGETYIGRTKNYKLIAVHSKKDLLGKFIEAEIIKTTPHYLVGKLLEIKRNI